MTTAARTSGWKPFLSRGTAGDATALDVPERLHAVLVDAMPFRATAEILTSELSILWYALASWGRPPHVPAGMRGYSYHRRSGVTAIFVVLLVATLVETLALHFVLRLWSPHAAWTLTALSVFAAVWLLGFLRAIRLRPVLLGDESLVVRAGLRWTVEIPLDAIARVDGGRSAQARASEPETLRATSATQPNVFVAFDRAIEARGLYGRRRSVRSIAFTVDDPGLVTRLQAYATTDA